MENIKVNKTELLKKLRENRDTHVADFEIAWEAFRKKAVNNAEQLIDSLKNAPKGADVNLHINLYVPRNHVEDYDRVIAMCEWSIDDEMELSEQEVQVYILDNWQWKNQFTSSNTMYTGHASPSKVV